MDLEVRRTQTDTVFSNTIFNLHVKLKLSSVESAMLEEYSLKKLVVVPATKFQKYINHIIIFLSSLLGSWFFTAIIVSVNSPKSRYAKGGLDSPTIAIIFIVLAILFYLVAHYTFSPDKKIEDLINSSTFKCNSLFQIKEVEENIEQVTIQLKKLLEDCAFYGGVDIIKIERDKDKDFSDGEEEKSTAFKEKYVITKTRYKKEPENID